MTLSRINLVTIAVLLQLGFILYLYSPLQDPTNELGKVNISALEEPVPEEEDIEEEDVEEIIEKVKTEFFMSKDGSFYKARFTNPLSYKNIIQPETTRESYIPLLELSCYVIDPDHLNIIIRDANKTRFEIPREDPYPHPKNPQYLSIEKSNFEFISEYEPFNLIIKRKSTQEVIFSLIDRLVYTDLYLEFSFNIPTKEIYGLGFRLSPLQFKPGVYSLFTLDRSGELDPGRPGFNGQGHHPMYLMKEKSGNYHTFLLRNINLGEVTLFEDQKIKWQLIGGVIDLNFFLGDTPESAVEKYHQYCDGWALPALWHMGYHQNKWGGYVNNSDLDNVMTRFEEKKLPLDALWTDADHMLNGINFSIDEKRFPLDEVNEIFERHRKRWIPLFNAHISLPLTATTKSHPNLETLYLKDEFGKLCQGYFLWGKIQFIDFFHPKCEKFWDDMMWETDKKWKISGAWLDANEPTNINWKDKDYDWHKMGSHRYFNLPFIPGDRQNIYSFTFIGVDCVHANGFDEFNIRSMNALFQSKHSYTSLKKKFSYPFVLSRATVFGGAKYAFTWAPDVHSNWESLKVSTGAVLTYGIFGYAMSGADVCGFVSEKQAEPELCARWHQVGAFYPFARNSHATARTYVINWQEPYLFSGIYFDAIYRGIQLRYSLLKYFYAVFFSRKSHGTERKIGLVIRPLFFDFHNESSLPPYGHDVHETQILFGDSIMVATIPYKNTSSIDVYFPNHRWFDLRSYEEVPVRGQTLFHVSGLITESMPYYLKGGHIFMTQNVDGVMNTDDLSNTFTLIIGLSDSTQKEEIRQSSAQGKILGVSSYQEEYIYDHCTLKNCILVITAEFETEGSLKPVLKLEGKAEKRNTLLDSIQVNEIILMGVSFDVQKNIDSVKIEDHPEIPVEMENIQPGTFRLKFSELDLNDESLFKFIFE